MPCALAMLAVSFALRWFWLPLHDRFGTYASDIWYMHLNYGYFLARQGFFAIEYQAGYFALVKVLAIICRSLFPATCLQQGELIFSYEAWLGVCSAFLVGVALWLVWTIHRLDLEHFHVGTRRLLLGLVLTPTFAWFSLFNFDLVPMACCTAALLYLLRGDDELPFELLALGASVKLFPALLVPAFLLRIAPGRRWRAIGLFVVVCIAVNLPFVLADFHAWSFPYVWQQHYDLTEPSPGRPLYHLAGLVGRLPVHLLLAGPIAWVLGRRFLEERQRGFEATAVTPTWLVEITLWVLVAFILDKSVFGAQYIFWLLPWLVLVPAGGAGVPAAHEAPSRPAEPYPWRGLGTLYELLNIGEVAGLDTWRSGHMAWLVALRAVRDTGLLALLAWRWPRVVEAPGDAQARGEYPAP